MFQTSARSFSSLFISSSVVSGQRHAQHEGAEIRHRLAHLHAEQPEELRQDQNCRNEEQTRARSGADRSLNGLADGLKHHVRSDDKGAQRQENALQPQRERADLNDLRSSFRKIAMICGAKAMPTMEPINSTQKAKLTVNQKALRTRP